MNAFRHFSLPARLAAGLLSLCFLAANGQAAGSSESFPTQTECKEAFRRMAETNPESLLPALSALRADDSSAWEGLCKDLYDEFVLGRKRVRITGLNGDRRVWFNGVRVTNEAPFSVSVDYGETKRFELAVSGPSDGCEATNQFFCVSWSDSDVSVALSVSPREKRDAPVWTMPDFSGRWRRFGGKWEERPADGRISLDSHATTTFEIWDWKKGRIYTYQVGGTDLHRGDAVPGDRMENQKIAPSPESVRGWVQSLQPGPLQGLKDLFARYGEENWAEPDEKTLAMVLDELKADSLYAPFGLGEEAQAAIGRLKKLDDKVVRKFVAFCMQNSTGLFQRLRDIRREKQKTEKYIKSPSVKNAFKDLFSFYEKDIPETGPTLEQVITVLERFQTDLKAGAFMIRDQWKFESALDQAIADLKDIQQ